MSKFEFKMIVGLFGRVRGCVLEEFSGFRRDEFGSGTLAGNQVLASFLFILALALGFKYPRSAAISALVACVFSLPLYLYLVFPRPFRQVWPGEWKVLEMPRETFIWDGWWITGILFTVFVACLCAAWCDTCNTFRPAFDAIALARPQMRFVARTGTGFSLSTLRR